MPAKGNTKAIYGEPIEVSKMNPEDITHDILRDLTNKVTMAIQQMSGQEYVDEYAQTVKKRMQDAREER